MLHRNWLTAGAVCVAMALVVAAAAYFYSQRPTSADGQAMILPVDPTPLVAVTKSGERSFSIEIADTSNEREAGLMFRQDMADDHGMLFVFEESRDLTFWMKNTPMPLDLLFIAQDGTIKAIKRGESFSEAVISPGVPVRFVLELKAGIASKNGIVDGEKARHRAINQAAGAAQPVQD